MNEKIEKILQELYSIDPSFREDERGLREILEKILASRPIVKIDEAFRLALRQKLKDKASEKKSFIASLADFFTLKKAVWTAASLAMVAVIAIPLYSFFLQGNKSISNSGSGYQISRVADQAFGEITTNSTNTVSQSESASGFGGGGLNTKDTSATTPMIAPDFSGYKYIYEGQISLAGLDNQVLKRVVPTVTQGLDSFLFSFNFGLIDLGSFKNASVSYIILKQTGDSAYEINIDRQRGTISLAQVWPSSAKDTVTIEMPNLTASDMLSESELIKISDQFISEHQINITGYGKPELLASYYQANLINSAQNFPESVSLVYPININDRYVYNTSGEKTGLIVNLSQRTKRVTSLSFLSSQQYQASAYALETDPAKILQMAEQGGIYPNYYGTGKTTDYQLESPQNGYLALSSDNEDLLVPALVFPVKNVESYQRNVVVPVVAGLAENIGGGIIRPAAGTGSATKSE